MILMKKTTALFVLIFTCWIDVRNLRRSHYFLSIGPGILGVTLCFFTGSYEAATTSATTAAAAAAAAASPIDYLIRFWLIFVVTLTLNFQGQIWSLLYLSQNATTPKANILTELKASNVIIRFDLGHDLDLQFSRSNMEFAISQPKVVWLPQNEKLTHRLNSRPQMWPMGLTLTMTFTFECWRSNATLIFDHSHDLGHGFPWPNFEIAVSQNGRAD